MNVLRISLGEVRYRKLGFLLGLVAVVVAVGSVVASMLLLRLHDIETESILAGKEKETRRRLKALENEVRKATLKLSFNLVILPEGQDIREWYTRDYSSKYMPEEYVDMLADSGIVLVRHFLPSLQEKIKWPETKRTIILVGTRGEVPNLHKSPKKPLVQAVPKGTIVLGHELHRSMGLKDGQTTRLMEREFTVHKCHPKRGNKDDITAWIHLSDAQELLDKKGKINAILALECICAQVGSLAEVRKQITDILPGTQVIEKGSRVVARAEARLKLRADAKAILANARERRALLKGERERITAMLAALLVAACATWLAVLGYGNVWARRSEIGVMRAMGYRSRHIALLFLSRFLALGLMGAVLGLVGGIIAGDALGVMLDESGRGMIAAKAMLQVGHILGIVALSCILTLIAGWIPAMVAMQQDPATVLRGE